MSQVLPSTQSNPTLTLTSPTETVSRFLSTFSHRQSLQQAIRGIAIGIFTLLCGTAIIVAADWAMSIPDATRWLMSCLAYAVAFVVAWWNGASKLLVSPNTESIAWSVEQSRPTLRESLLSTVELRRPDGSTRSGSPAFVDAIEHQVALELNQLSVNVLLPWQSIAKSLMALTTTIVLVLAACCIPSANIPVRLARAMVPFLKFHFQNTPVNCVFGRWTSFTEAHACLNELKDRFGCQTAAHLDCKRNDMIRWHREECRTRVTHIDLDCRRT